MEVYLGQKGGGHSNSARVGCCQTNKHSLRPQSLQTIVINKPTEPEIPGPKALNPRPYEAKPYKQRPESENSPIPRALKLHSKIVRQVLSNWGRL